MPALRLETAYRDRLVKTLDEDGIVLEKYYLAVKMQFKTAGRPWNKMRLLLVTPFKWLLATRREKKTLEKYKLRFLFPFNRQADPVMDSIKQFIHEN